MDNKRKINIHRKPLFWIIVLATFLAAAVAYLLVESINSETLSPMRKDAVYRNGLYFVTSRIENNEINAILKNDVIYYEGRISGEIEISGNFEIDYPEDTRNLMDTLNDQFTFKWSYVETERTMVSHGSGYTCEENKVVDYIKKIDEFMEAGDEDILVNTYITGFETPLQFIIPAEGSTPQWGMLYGTFSPRALVYLSPYIDEDPKDLLKAAKEVVFTVTPETFSICNPNALNIIGEMSFETQYNSGSQLDDTLDVITRSASRMDSDSIDISEYTSKIRYSAFPNNFDVSKGYYHIFLMDDETWIGRWNFYGTDNSENRCDFLFRVESIKNMQ